MFHQLQLNLFPVKMTGIIHIDSHPFSSPCNMPFTHFVLMQHHPKYHSFHIPLSHSFNMICIHYYEVLQSV